ncbi:hypothetical protein GW758_01580 [Candidatus Falkowbacteria bacterium]|nr:hypothetical protein [Candidatus Falkowbacteria bacterium]
MNEKTYLRLIQFGLIASLFIVFFVFKALLFPYITSKQFAFNILIELLFALWLVFILKFPKYRPKKNLITYGLVAYFVAILMSVVVSVDPALSLWGDAERMLGFFHVFHFFLFFLMLISTFRSWKDYKILLLTSVIVATVVSLNGIFGEQRFSTIGNTAYVSGYLIFNIFFAIILFFREQHKLWRLAYIVPILIMLWEFWICRTSGAIIGLFLSLMLLIFLFGVLHERKKIRRLSLITFIIAVITVVGLFSQYQADWFQKSFLRNLTPQKVTFQTRLISWEGAAKDFKNHPIFGTGFGNYAIIFDRHFDSRFFNYTTSETYFDRAHNNLIDIASTTGTVGLLAYLSIFVAALFYLFSELKANGYRVALRELKQRRNLEIIIIISLLAAYFIQNLAIFDSFVTYLGMMIILGFIYYLRSEREDRGVIEGVSEIKTVASSKIYLKKQSTEVFLLIILLLSAYIFTANFNLKPKRTLEGAIQAYSLGLSGQAEASYKMFQEVLKDHPLERDARVVVINLFTSNWEQLKTLEPARADEIIEFVIGLAQKNVEYNPYDSLMQMQLSQVADVAARFYGNDNLEKANFYSSLAMQAIEYAIEASPGRAPVYLVKAQMLLTRGENDAAIETVEYAISLNDKYYEGYCRLAQFYMYLQVQDGLKEALNSCIDLNGASSISSSQFLTSSIGYLVDEGDFERAITFALRLTVLYPNDAETFLNVAKIYLIMGENDLSAQYLRQAYAFDPKIADDWEMFLDFWLGEEGDGNGDETGAQL